MTPEGRWANAIRALAVVAALTTTVAVLEARAVRRMRAELQQLRTERGDAKAGGAAAWARQSREETSTALRALNDFYENSSDGVGRPGGLCPATGLDADAIATFALGVFIQARADGQSMERAIVAMQDAVLTAKIKSTP
jgi:hypothetical protein